MPCTYPIYLDRFLAVSIIPECASELYQVFASWPPGNPGNLSPEQPEQQHASCLWQTFARRELGKCYASRLSGVVFVDPRPLRARAYVWANLTAKRDPKATKNACCLFPLSFPEGAPLRRGFGPDFRGKPHFVGPARDIGPGAKDLGLEVST